MKSFSFSISYFPIMSPIKQHSLQHHFACSLTAIANEHAIEQNNETLESLTFSPQLFRIVGRISHVVAVRHKATAHLQVLHVKRSIAIRSEKLLVEPAYGIVLRHERVSMQINDHGLRLIG